MAEEHKNKTLLIESQYFPSIYFYKTLIKHDILLIEKYEHYQKLSYRNRCYIAGPNGTILLSVPLSRGKNQRTVMKDVRISNEEKWQGQHWKTLVSAYRRSPWFEYHEEDLGKLFERPHQFLLDWNLACFEWVNKVMGLSCPVNFTTEYIKEYDNSSGITDARDQLRPGRDVPGKDLPASESLRVQGGDTSEKDLPAYTQVFQERVGFMPNLSILDLIFCEGRNSLSLLK